MSLNSMNYLVLGKSRHANLLRVDVWIRDNGLNGHHKLTDIEIWLLNILVDLVTDLFILMLTYTGLHTESHKSTYHGSSSDEEVLPVNS